MGWASEGGSETYGVSCSPVPNCERAGCWKPGSTVQGWCLDGRPALLGQRGCLVGLFVSLSCGQPIALPSSGSGPEEDEHL